MKPLVAAAAFLPALFAASPAHATQGLLCRPVSGSGPSLGLVLAAGGGVAGANLTEGGALRSSFRERDGLAVRQSWIDEARVWVDLTDPQRLRDEGRLRGSFVRRGRSTHVTGTFVRNGRVYRVRCAED